MSVTATITNLSEADYPDALKSTGFSNVWVIGQLDILRLPLLGLFCSSKCPGDAILKTYDIAKAIRDARIPVISGFHSSMEKECLSFLLRGTQPVVVCPARGIQKMRIPTLLREPLEDKRLLVLSPFEEKHQRVTGELADKRNRFVAKLATTLLFAHAGEGSKSEQLLDEQLQAGKEVYVVDVPSNGRLAKKGAKPVATGDVDTFLETSG